MRVGDAITAIDAIDVSDQNFDVYRNLTSVPAGTAVSFTLSDGSRHTVIAR